jgi:hypothetical protein
MIKSCPLSIVKKFHLLFKKIPLARFRKSINNIYHLAFIHKKYVAIFLVITLLISGFFLYRHLNQPKLSKEGQIAIESFKDNFPQQTKTGPQFVVGDRDLLNNPQNFIIEYD